MRVELGDPSDRRRAARRGLARVPVTSWRRVSRHAPTQSTERVTQIILARRWCKLGSVEHSCHVLLLTSQVYRDA